ncbi:hypothetical protein R3P38DRAFT_3197521 [Favolaschia claudopus]|uniref:Uncharacterized protein n=1 Tax=Favolaschia claudopus TaxID=2862362 RepID=A0AAW0B4K8_9AGAR
MNVIENLFGVFLFRRRKRGTSHLALHARLTQNAKQTRARNREREEAKEAQLHAETQAAGGRNAKKLALKKKVWDPTKTTNEAADSASGAAAASRKRAASTTGTAKPPKKVKSQVVKPQNLDSGAYSSVRSTSSVIQLEIDFEDGMDVDAPVVAEPKKRAKPSKAAPKTSKSQSGATDPARNGEDAILFNSVMHELYLKVSGAKPTAESASGSANNVISLRIAE